MKPQDIVWIVVFLLFLVIRKDRVTLIVGLACLVLAIPLFVTQTFFTAQRLLMYGASFIFLSSMLLLIRKDR